MDAVKIKIGVEGKKTAYKIDEEAGTDSEKRKQTKRNGSVMDGLLG